MTCRSKCGLEQDMSECAPISCDFSLASHCIAVMGEGSKTGQMYSCSEALRTECRSISGMTRG